jgi:hypothetical protein
MTPNDVLMAIQNELVALRQVDVEKLAEAVSAGVGFYGVGFYGDDDALVPSPRAE